MAGFVTPRYAGPQRESDWASHYAGAVNQANAAYGGRAGNTLAMAGMVQGDKLASQGRYDAAVQSVISAMQSAHGLQAQKDQMRQQRSAQRASLGMQAGSMAVSGAMGVGNLALGAGNLAVNQGQLALAQQMWGVVP